MRPQPRRQLSTGLSAARVRAGGQLVFWGDVHILGPEHVQLRARRVRIGMNPMVNIAKTKTAAEHDRKPGTKWLSCAAK